MGKKKWYLFSSLMLFAIIAYIGSILLKKNISFSNYYLMYLLLAANIIWALSLGAAIGVFVKVKTTGNTVYDVLVFTALVILAFGFMFISTYTAIYGLDSIILFMAGGWLINMTRKDSTAK